MEVAVVPVAIRPVPAAARTVGAVGTVGSPRTAAVLARPIRAVPAAADGPVGPVGSCGVVTVGAGGTARASVVVAGLIRAVPAAGPGPVGPVGPVGSAGGVVGPFGTTGPVRSIRTIGSCTVFAAVRSGRRRAWPGLAHLGGGTRDRPFRASGTVRVAAGATALDGGSVRTRGPVFPGAVLARLGDGPNRRREGAGKGGDGGEGHQQTFHDVFPRMPLSAACGPMSVLAHEPGLNAVRRPIDRKPRERTRGVLQGVILAGPSRRSTARWR